MPYEPIAHGPLQGLDYHAERPFMGWRRPDLIARMVEWLSANPPRLELATLALDELRVRGASKAEKGRLLFRQSGHQPIEWLSRTREIVRKELPVSSDRRRKGNLYVILRDGYAPQNGFYGAYVGATAKTVEKRFVQHRTGVAAARGLEIHGIELLYSLFCLANPVPGGVEERLRAETELHRLISRAGVRTTGDIIP